MAGEWYKRDPDDGYEYLDLPSDPKDLTRELALQVFEHPEVFTREFARLALELLKLQALEDGEPDHA